MYYYNNELYHHGVKGQRWGVRRYQNKDGSLTLAGKKRALKMQDEYTKFTDNPKYRDKQGNLTYAGRRKALKMKEQYSQLTGKKLTRYPGVKKQNDQQGDSSKKKNPGEETLEEKRARLLKSNDPVELYKNRDILTTNELNERINRIDTEQRLLSKIPQETTKKGSTFVEKLDKAKTIIDKTGNVVDSFSRVAKQISNTEAGKQLLKKLGIDLNPKKTFDADKFWKNKDGKTDKEIADAAQRLQNERKIQNELDRRKKAKEEAKQKEKVLKDAQKQVDDYNKRREERENSYYRMKGAGSSNKGDAFTSNKNVKSGSSFVDQLFKDGSGTASSSNVNTGRDYTNTLLLEDKRMVNGRYLLPGS